MRAVVQRVRQAEVTVGGESVARIGRGVLALVGIHRADTTTDAEWMAAKIARLRIFPDEQGRFAHSLADTGGAALIVSQFTLHGDARKGRRPSFTDAAEPERARELYEQVIAFLRREGVPTLGGRFGAQMEVALVNDGPVTILLFSPSENPR